MSQNLSNRSPEKIVTLLAIENSSEDLASLRAVVSNSNWTMQEAVSCKSALNYLRRHRIPVVLCDRTLSDGTWKDVYYQLLELPEVPLLIVTSRLADDSLWAEVLNLGAYDVLAKPYERTELVRVVGSAWLHWKQRPERKRPLASQVVLRASSASF
jgi:DNA-binding response OmpR family regulator